MDAEVGKSITLGTCIKFSNSYFFFLVVCQLIKINLFFKFLKYPLCRLRYCNLKVYRIGGVLVYDRGVVRDIASDRQEQEQILLKL